MRVVKADLQPLHSIIARAPVRRTALAAEGFLRPLVVVTGTGTKTEQRSQSSVATK